MSIIRSFKQKLPTGELSELYELGSKAENVITKEGKNIENVLQNKLDKNMGIENANKILIVDGYSGEVSPRDLSESAITSYVASDTSPQNKNLLWIDTLDSGSDIKLSYAILEDVPKINSHILKAGNNTSDDLGLADKSSVDNLRNSLNNKLNKVYTEGIQGQLKDSILTLDNTGNVILENRPKINNHLLQGELTLQDLGIQPIGNYISSGVFTERNQTVDNSLNTKLNKNLGSSNNGKILKVDSTGLIQPTDFSTFSINYNKITSKPQINSHELIGNKTSKDLGLVTQQDLNNKLNKNQGVENKFKYLQVDNEGNIQYNEPYPIYSILIKDLGFSVNNTDLFLTTEQNLTGFTVTSLQDRIDKINKCERIRINIKNNIISPLDLMLYKSLDTSFLSDSRIWSATFYLKGKIINYSLVIPLSDSDSVKWYTKIIK